MKEMSTVGKRVLVIDDDEQLLEVLGLKLVQAGYRAVLAATGETGERRARQGTFDVIVLDVIMPRVNGIELCATLRARGVLAPILILSGECSTKSVVQGLHAGADDYLTKPFSSEELLARLSALLRRHRQSFTSQVLEYHGTTLDVAARTLQLGDRLLPLTRKETMLIKRLLADAPKPVPRLALLRDVWGITGDYASNRLDVYIRRLRCKLYAATGAASIRTIRSGGYCFELLQPLAPLVTDRE